MTTSGSLISQHAALGATDTEIVAFSEPNSRCSGLKAERKCLVWPIVAAAVIALTVSSSRLSQSLPARQAVRLDFDVVSATPFLQQIPRISRLGIMHHDGSREVLTSRRYCSTFLDERSTLYFDIVDPKATRFFFSPARAGEVVTIKGLRVVFKSTRQKVQIPLTALSPARQLQVLQSAADRLVLKTLPGNGVPLLTFELPARPSASLSTCVIALLDALGFFLLAFIASLATIHAVLRRPGGLRLRAQTVGRTVPFVVAFSLICVMAWCSRFNAHPDEYLHFETAKYYVSHWLPPALDDPSIEPSFSHYGVSYLQNLDAAYFAVGKFMAVLPPRLVSRETAGRLFNPLLFGLLAGWLVRRLGRSFAPGILLMTPQLWYVFSYINGDAWALALSLMIVGLLADEGSIVSRYLQANQPVQITGGVVLGALLGLLLMAKHNYYVLFAFVSLVILCKGLVWSGPASVELVIRKTAVIIAAVAAVNLPLTFVQEKANRFELPQLQIQQAEKLAAPMFKPSAISATRDSPQIALREQGKPFWSVLNSDWSTRTYQSFCGVYHWMSLPGPSFYYVVMTGLYVSFLAGLCFALRRLPGGDLFFCGATFLLAIGLVLLSAYQSWVADFQPQGRYLFPILPMFAFLLHRYRELLSTRAFNLLFAALFTASTFSFVFTGLRNFLT